VPSCTQYVHGGTGVGVLVEYVPPVVVLVVLVTVPVPGVGVVLVNVTGVDVLVVVVVVVVVVVPVVLVPGIRVVVLVSVSSTSGSKYVVVDEPVGVDVVVVEVAGIVQHSYTGHLPLYLMSTFLRYGSGHSSSDLHS
jgi:hypothetical protein